MSSVAPTQTSEAGGLQGTAQNLGSSLGTAIIGAVLLASLATGFSERITTDPDVPPAARETIAANTQEGIDIVTVETVEQAALDGGLNPDQARAVAADYGDAQLDALRLALGAVALAAVLVAAIHAATADHIARGDRGRCRGGKGDRVASRMAPAPIGARRNTPPSAKNHARFRASRYATS